MSEILKIGEIEVEENMKRSGTLKVAGRSLSPIEVPITMCSSAPGLFPEKWCCPSTTRDIPYQGKTWILRKTSTPTHYHLALRTLTRVTLDTGPRILYSVSIRQGRGVMECPVRARPADMPVSGSDQLRKPLIN